MLLEGEEKRYISPPPFPFPLPPSKISWSHASSSSYIDGYDKEDEVEEEGMSEEIDDEEGEDPSAFRPKMAK